MKKYKNDFPIFTDSSLIYLDSAATSQKPRAVIDAISDFYENSNANVKRGIYPLAGKATELVEGVRKKVAAFINANSEQEIIFTRNTTESINLIAYSMSHNISKKDIIATTILEHHSNFVPWQMLAARTNSLFEVLDISEDLALKLTDFSKTKILAISLVSNVLGNIVDVTSIIKRARKENPDIIVVIDAAQAMSHFPVDVQNLDCDFLAFSGHKMFAGMGVGVLYGKKERLKNLDPFLFGGQMIEEVSLKKTTFRQVPDKFEAGTLSAADIVSFGVAIDYIDSIGFDEIESREDALRKYLLEELRQINGLDLIGDTSSQRKIGVIPFVLKNSHPHDIAQILGDNGICVRAGHHCCMPLHKRLGLNSTVRASLSVYNDKKDIDMLVEGLKKIKKIFDS